MEKKYQMELLGISKQLLVTEWEEQRELVDRSFGIIKEEISSRHDTFAGVIDFVFPVVESLMSLPDKTTVVEQMVNKFGEQSVFLQTIEYGLAAVDQMAVYLVLCRSEIEKFGVHASRFKEKILLVVEAMKENQMFIHDVAELNAYLTKS